MNAAEVVAVLAALPGARDSGADSDGINASRLLNGVEYAHTSAVDEPKLRSSWKRRQGGGATPLVLLADDPEQQGFVRVLGPQREGRLRRVRSESLLGVVERTLSAKRLQAVRLLAEELDRLDTERIAGLKVQGLGTEHLYGKRLPKEPRWDELSSLVEGVSRAGWRELLGGLGYTIEPLKPSGYLAKAGGRPVIVVHPRANTWLFARLDEHGRLPEGALVADCAIHGAPYGILAAGTRLRLLSAGKDDAGATTRYLELDAAALEPDMRPLLGLLHPRYLVDRQFRAVLEEARDHGQALRRRLDKVLREHVLPVLGRELGVWARQVGWDLADDTKRAELEAAALQFVFQALFLLYAESAGYLPVGNPTYRSKSLTRIAERAYEERDAADAASTSLWDDIASLVKRMRTGHKAWELPAYNGDLFSAEAMAGAALLERAAIRDAALTPALVALARDADDPEIGVDFSGLEIGQLGYIYEGLLSLRLSLADRDFAYDAKADRYVAPEEDAQTLVRRGELLWLTDEGGRKGAGVYYTRTELVRHLVRGAIAPAFNRHLLEIRELAKRDPAAAADRLFDFFVLDPACGSAHFLVEVVDELSDNIAKLLGDVALPAISEQLEGLRKGAGAFGAGIEDTALLKRLVLKRCVFGVDLSAMGVEIAKVSLWLATFIPGLSLAYLDHNVQRGNSLIGVARPEDVGDGTLFGDALARGLENAARAAAALRLIDDTTPDQVAASRAANKALRKQAAAARSLFNLWTAEPLGLSGARDEALREGANLLAGDSTSLCSTAEALAEQEHVLHWPLAFAEVFARDRPGFDAVVGNPPWNEVTIERASFFARYRPGIRRGVGSEIRDAAVAALLEERPELEAKYAEEQEAAARQRRYVAAAFPPMRGDPDLYKYFCRRYGMVLRRGGALAVVLPRSTFVNEGSAGFREWLFLENCCDRLDFLTNRGKWAFDVHAQQSVALVLARRLAVAQDDLPVEIAGTASSLKEWGRQSSQGGVPVRRRAFGPGLWPPVLRDAAEADVLGKVRTGSPFPFGPSRSWACFPVRELEDVKADRALWENAKDGWALWKGESIDQYNPHGGGAQRCPPNAAVIKKVTKTRPGAESLVASSHSVARRRAAAERERVRARVAFNDVTQRTNSRTVVACLVPPETFLLNSAPYLVFVTGDDFARAACLGIMNSLCFDWQARRFAETHMNYFVLEGLVVPDVSRDELAEIARDAAQLSCPDERFADFAAATGVSTGALDDEARLGLRANIDARVARAWKLTTDDLDVVFRDFTFNAVSSAYRDRVRTRFAELG